MFMEIDEKYTILFLRNLALLSLHRYSLSVAIAARFERNDLVQLIKS